MTRIRALLALLVGMPLILLVLATGPASATAPTAKITIANQAPLLTDGTAVVTVDYNCAPGPGGVTTGSLFGELIQLPTFGQLLGPGAATCDGHVHRASLDMAPGPFTQGSATAQVGVSNVEGSFATTSRTVTVR